MKRPLLYCIPIVHNAADLGSLADKARELSSRGDDAAWRRKQLAIRDFWKGVEAWCARLPRDLSAFRIYQDGLPVCGRERAIVEELAAKGSDNHRIILALLARGATLEGTESGPLLIEEYRLAQQALAPATSTGVSGGSGGSAGGEARAGAEILNRRDQFIAQRVRDTLKAGETGLLFIGYMHDVLTKLPSMIDVQKVSRPA